MQHRFVKVSYWKGSVDAKRLKKQSLKKVVALLDKVARSKISFQCQIGLLKSSKKVIFKDWPFWKRPNGNQNIQNILSLKKSIQIVASKQQGPRNGISFYRHVDNKKVFLSQLFISPSNHKIPTSAELKQYGKCTFIRERKSVSEKQELEMVTQKLWSCCA